MRRGEWVTTSGLHLLGIAIGLASFLQARGVWVELSTANSFPRPVVCDDLSTLLGVLALIVCVALSMLTALLGVRVCVDCSFALTLLARGVCVEQFSVFGLPGLAVGNEPSSTILLAKAVCVD